MINISELDIVSDILKSLSRGDLTETQLLRYFEDNKNLLKQNIYQAKVKYKENDIDSIVNKNFPLYTQSNILILANYNRFVISKDLVIEKIINAFGDDLPDIVLVPCLGLYSAGGWADNIGGIYHIFVAMERLPEDFSMELLLSHEIAHGISDIQQHTVLDGFYNEGYATYVSSVLYPGQCDYKYFFSMDQELYKNYLEWIDTNRDRIFAHSDQPFVVLDDIHKLYFTTSFSDYPNIGYVIGFKYVAHLHKTYTLKELGTFCLNAAENRKAFAAYISSYKF